jgi:hypothetical protein
MDTALPALEQGRNEKGQEGEKRGRTKEERGLLAG